MKTYITYNALDYYPKSSGLRFANIVSRLTRQIITTVDYSDIDTKAIRFYRELFV